MCKSVRNQLITGNSVCMLTWYTMVSNSIFTRALQPASSCFSQMVIIIYYGQCEFFQNFRDMHYFIGDCQKNFLVSFPTLKTLKAIGFAGSYDSSCWTTCTAVWTCDKAVFSLSLKPGNLLCHLVYGLK